MAPKLISIDEVMLRTSIGRTKLYELIKTGDFPAPVKIGAASRWVEAEISDWIEAQMLVRL